VTDIAQAELARIAAKLESRGTRLRPPADDQTITRLEVAIGGPLSRYSRALYSTFDGFDQAAPDEKTMVCLWSAETICGRANTGINSSKGQLIGDYFLDADLFRCDLRSDVSKVWWDERGTIAAVSLLELCRQIGDGTFEF
jgi:hypothetical protein